MKRTLLPILFGLALATTAQAGPDPMPSGKEIIPPPPPSCLWTWFAGGSAGYVSDDWDEEMYTLHFGTERKCGGDDCSHALYLEVGYTEKDASIVVPSRLQTHMYGPYPGTYKVHAEIIPITLNYKYECALTGSLNWYLGVGGGIALVDVDFSGSHSYDDNVWYAHVFTGVVYNFSETFEVFGGVRYIWMDDPELTGFPVFDKHVTLDGNFFFEIGARINF